MRKTMNESQKIGKIWERELMRDAKATCGHIDEQLVVIATAKAYAAPYRRKIRRLEREVAQLRLKAIRAASVSLRQNEIAMKDARFSDALEARTNHIRNVGKLEALQDVAAKMKEGK